jgi:hypothetical protein
MEGANVQKTCADGPPYKKRFQPKNTGSV